MVLAVHTSATQGEQRTHFEGPSGEDPRRSSIGFASRQAPAQRFMGHLMFSGVFDRHPKLKVTCAEYDVGWVAHIYQHRSPDRKSTRLNSSHGYISYAVFCLKKKKTVIQRPTA